MFQNGSRFREPQTDAERAAWYMLRNRQLDGVKFRRQCPMGRYVADFYGFEAALVIGLDGGAHSQPIQMRKDATKDAFLKSQGIRVLRVPNAMVLDHAEEFLQRVHDALVQDLAA